MFNLVKKLKAKKLAKARRAAWLAHREALAKNDTRRQHETRAELSRTTHAKLRAELGW